MLSIVQSTVLALAVASYASAHTISHVHRRHAQLVRATPPEGWATNYLEPYDNYHTRYLAIDCENKHNTTTFDLCCHPMLATETLAKNRNACCVPGATVACPGETSSLVVASKTSSAAAAATPSSVDDEDCDGDDEDDDDDTGDDEECDSEDEGDDQDDGDDEDCSDEGDDNDEPTSSAPTSSAKAAVRSTSADAATPTPKSTTEKATTPTSSQVKTTATPATKAEPSTTPKSTATKTSTSQQSTTTTSSGTDFITGGFGTWFTQNGVAGACGKVHKDTDFVVALQTSQYDNGANCGRTVEIVDLNNGKTTTALVADECPSCINKECLDMSESLFEFFEDLSVGQMSIKWKFTN